MPNVAKLKKKAADFELKKQFDKALAVYIELLAVFDEHADELDVALFNRVGDILLRQGNVADAVDYYEKAVDHYSDGGFFNNAIALCNKILRHSPGRTSIYYKLGKISAQKGFKNDAKQNFLEYADRMQKSGRIDEAFRALTEFADLCPDQDDIRLMLADQLLKAGRPGEAVEQLQLLHERYDAEGRTAEASAAAARMRAIDATVQPRAGGATQQRSSQDLVFLDLSSPAPAPQGGTPAAAPRPAAPPPSRPAPPRSAPMPAALADLPIIESGTDEPERAPEPARPAPPPVPRPAAPAAGRPAAPPAARPPAAAAPARPAPAPPPAAAEPDLELADPPLPEAADAGIELSDAPLPETAADDTVNGAAPIAGLEPTYLADDGAATGAPSQLLDIEATSFGSDIGGAGIMRGFPSDAESLLGPVDSSFGGSDASVVEPAAEPIFDFGTEMLDDPAGGTYDAAAPEPMELSEPPAPVQRPAAQPHARTGEGRDASRHGIEPPRAPRSSGEILAELEPPILREQAAGTSEPEIPLLDFHMPEPTTQPGRTASAPVPELTLADDLDATAGPASRKPAPRRAPADDAAAFELIVPDAAEPESAEEIEVELAIEEETEAAPLAPRSATMYAARSVEALLAAVEGDPENVALRRELGEAMLDAGDREGGIHELELAMAGAERANDLDLAARIAEEITKVDPGTIRHLQKRVEYAFRTNDRPRLIEAYLALGEALGRTEQVDKARAVYQRVLDLAPDDIRAQAALEALPAPEAEPAPPPARRGTNGTKSAAPKVRGRISISDDDASFVNLGDLLRDESGPADLRMVVEEHEPTGDEEADFQDMLRKFKQGIAQNVEQEDYQSHYDLGVAFKEMGLVDEAIAEFQKALRAPTNRVPTYEALGQCFIEKEQYSMAATVLSRALTEDGNSDDQLVGVLYLLGRAAEALNRREEALNYYQRVFLVDIEFQDVANRVRELERVAR